MTAVRLAHLSDVHVSADRLGWAPSDWLTKRVTGWVNTFLLSRRWRFRDAASRVRALANELQVRKPDAVIFSGDASMLGFPAEVEHAARLLGVGAADALPGLAVPGNHDYYIPAAERSGAFEHCFAPWQTGERIDGAIYPFARQLGPLWLVGVNSAVGHIKPTDASGEVGAAQLQRLEKLLAGLPAGPRVLVTHYPVARRDGQPEKPSHELRDLAALLAVARQGGVRLWLHGHRHDWYVHRQESIVSICAGSATDADVAGYNEYTILDTRLELLRRAFDPVTCTYQDAETLQLDLA
jgi:3',5'-cyclic AMP phosphodiesterase CpdA